MQKGFVILPILVFLALLIGIGFFFVKSNHTNLELLVSLPKMISWPPISNQVPTPTPIIGNYDVVTELNSESICEADTNNSCKRDVYIRNKDTNEEIFLVTDDDIQIDSRNPTYKNGHVFLIKRIGNSKYSSTQWTDELWTYTNSKDGRKIYEKKGLNYIVSEDGGLVAIPQDYNSESHENSLTIIKVSDNSQVGTFMVNVNQCTLFPETRQFIYNFDLLSWSDDDQQIWGTFSGEYGIVICFWRLDTKSGEIKFFNTPAYSYINFNPNKLVMLYHDKPPFVEEEGYNNWKLTNSTYSLYLYHLDTKISEKIDTIVADDWVDNVQWIAEDKFVYQVGGTEKSYNLK